MLCWRMYKGVEGGIMSINNKERFAGGDKGECEKWCRWWVVTNWFDDSGGVKRGGGGGVKRGFLKNIFMIVNVKLYLLNIIYFIFKIF